MKAKYLVAAIAVMAIGFTPMVSSAAPIFSAVSTIGGSPIANFEGFAEGTIITNQYAGVTFGQVDGGTPMIDNSPFLFAFSQSSGEGVLTGSTNGGAFAPTIAGLTMTFAAAQSAVEFFLSDDATLGNYTLSAYGAGNALLETTVLTAAQVSGGHYVGFTGAGILRVTVDGVVENDAFGIDDLRASAAAVPEPASLLLLGAGLAAAAARRRRARA
jgi:hypothetical protein